MNSFLIFIFWPFLGFINSFRSLFNGKRDKLLLMLSSGFVGLNLAITSNSPDINRYVEEFRRYSDRGTEYLIEYLYQFVTFQEKHYDIGVQIVYYLASRITNNEHIFILILGLIYGFFFSRTIMMIFKYLRISTKNVYVYAFAAVIVLFFFPTQGINQFRFWTATMSFIYGYLLLSENKKKGYYFLILGPLIHIGLLFLIFLYGILTFGKKINYKILLLLLPLGFMLNIGFSSLIEPIVSFIGGSVEDKFTSYTGDIAESGFESFRGRVWYAAYWRDISLYSIFLLNCIYIFLKIGVSNLSKEVKELFNINIVFLFMALLMRGFFMHFRYYEVFIFFNLIFLVKLNYENKVFQLKKNRLMNDLYLGVFLFVLFIKIPGILQFLVPTFFISNYFTAGFFFDLQDTSTWDFIQKL